MKELILALVESGDIPNKAIANDVYMLASITEDSVEAVAGAMDMLGLDGSVAFDMALEI
jgi:hypothetical protein